MKKQFIIEVTETNHPHEQVYTPESYQAPGFYLNTTPDGQKQLMFKSGSELFGVAGIYDNPAPDAELMNHLKPVPAADEAPQITLEQINNPATVTNAELLKFIAVANNPYLVTEIIKTEAAIDRPVNDEY